MTEEVLRQRIRSMHKKRINKRIISKGRKRRTKEKNHKKVDPHTSSFQQAAKVSEGKRRWRFLV